MNTPTTVINVRIDKATKAKAQKIVSNLGLDISSAIKAFLHKVIQTKSIPFILEERGVMNDPKYIIQLRKEEAQALKNAKRYRSGAEIRRDILGE